MINGTSNGLIIINGTNGVTVAANLATPNDGGRGFFIFGTGHIVKGNLAISNGEGFAIDGSGNQIIRNIASKNRRNGFLVTGDGGHTLKGSLASVNDANGFDVSTIANKTSTLTAMSLQVINSLEYW